MKGLFIDCPSGLSGDMLLASLLDLGVPEVVIKKPLSLIGLDHSYSLRSEESSSYGLRGLKIFVEAIEEHPPSRSWKEIKALVVQANFTESLRNMVLDVFTELAEAEAYVHGCNVDEVHFHEVGAIDSLVDVVGVCAAVEYLQPSKIFCTSPPVGSGYIESSHGNLPVPVPAVLEIAKKNKIKLLTDDCYPKQELTTPTGLALMAVLSDTFSRPVSCLVNSIGIGMGHRNIGQPNLLRTCTFEVSSFEITSSDSAGLIWQNLIIQESWIDDSTPEDLADFAEQLRSVGALEVGCQPIQMKKGRQGTKITAIFESKNGNNARSVWLSKGTTLGLREHSEGRWVLERRVGICKTSIGDVKVKQVRRPDGRLTIKPEHSELVRLSNESSISIDEARVEVFRSLENFIPIEEWKY